MTVSLKEWLPEDTEGSPVSFFADFLVSVFFVTEATQFCVTAGSTLTLVSVLLAILESVVVDPLFFVLAVGVSLSLR